MPVLGKCTGLVDYETILQQCSFYSMVTAIRLLPNQGHRSTKKTHSQSSWTLVTFLAHFCLANALNLEVRLNLQVLSRE